METATTTSIESAPKVKYVEDTVVTMTQILSSAVETPFKLISAGGLSYQKSKQ